METPVWAFYPMHKYQTIPTSTQTKLQFAGAA
jgi:hypothetical protein